MAKRKTEDRMVVKTGVYNSDVHKMIKLTSKQKTEFTEQMTIFANNFLKDEFNLELSAPIEICGRLTRTGGSFHYNSRLKKSLKIKMSERFIACALLDNDGIEAILDILKHELVHHALFELDKPCRDGDYEFESTLARLHIGASGATNDKKILSQKENVWYTILDIYECKQTRKQYKYNHSQKETAWIGKRIGYEIVKTIF